MAIGTSRVHFLSSEIPSRAYSRLLLFVIIGKVYLQVDTYVPILVVFVPTLIFSPLIHFRGSRGLRL